MVDAMTDQIDQDVDRRTEQVLIAYLRQELSAPATAIMGYAEMLMGDAVQAGSAQRIDDLQRVLDASRSLHCLIFSLLDQAAIHLPDGLADPAEFRRMLRHDLRTPLNAIKGYAEMLREDAAAVGAETFACDLDKLLGEAALLLDRIDGLVTYSGTHAPAFDEVAHPVTMNAAPTRMAESLLKAVRPLRDSPDDSGAEVNILRFSDLPAR
jgi:adenylate cyclase